MNFGRNLPLPWEHMLFLGWLPMAALFLFLVFFSCRGESPELFRYRILFNALIFVFFLTLDILGVSLYWFVAHLPGASAIRSVTRVIVVMVFPIAAIFGYILSKSEDFLNKRLNQRKSPTRSVLNKMMLLTVLIFLFFDQLSQLPSFNKKDSQARIHFLKTEILRGLGVKVISGLVPKNTVVWVDWGKDSFFETQIDSMLASQDLGLGTINGYSGNLPAGYERDLSELGTRKCEGLRDWIALHRNAFTEKRILVLGTPCLGIQNMIYGGKN